MKVNGRTIKLPVKESTLILTELITTVNGWMTNSTVMGRKSGQMVLVIPETTLRVKSMVRDILNGLMAQTTKVTLRITTFMEKAFTTGLMEEDLTATGSTTRCMVKETLHGKMVDAMMVNTLKTKRKAREFLLGLMEEFTMDSGIWASSMELDTTLTQKAQSVKANGKTENV